jgi:RNA polymerase sigma-70 factor, ECF subfamily
MRDSTSFDGFYATTSVRVVAQLYAMLGDLAEAEDAVSEAYVRAWQRWRRVGEYADPTAWVRGVAYRIAVSSWRRGRNRRIAHERWGAGSDPTHLDPDTLALVEILRRIPPDQRRVLVLHHLAGLPVKEIADEVGATPGAVKTRLSRARQALAAQLNADEAREVEHHEQ